MNTLLRYIEANGVKMRKLKAYLRSSLTTFCRNLFERTKEMCEIILDVVMEIWLQRVGRGVELLFLHEPVRKQMKLIQPLTLYTTSSPGLFPQKMGGAGKGAVQSTVFKCPDKICNRF